MEALQLPIVQAVGEDNQSIRVMLAENVFVHRIRLDTCESGVDQQIVSPFNHASFDTLQHLGEKITTYYRQQQADGIGPLPGQDTRGSLWTVFQRFDRRYDPNRSVVLHRGGFIDHPADRGDRNPGAFSNVFNGWM